MTTTKQAYLMTRGTARSSDYRFLVVKKADVAQVEPDPDTDYRDGSWVGTLKDPISC